MGMARHSEEILDFKQFMEFIGVQKTTMYKIMQSPYAPRFTQIGSKKLITREAALQWIEQYAGMRIY